MAIFATFQNDVIFFNIKCILSRFCPKIYLMCVKSQFLYDFDRVCKMGNFATLPNRVFFLLLIVFVSRFPIELLFLRGHFRAFGIVWNLVCIKNIKCSAVARGGAGGPMLPPVFSHKK